jgi:hypothetical protein
MKIVVLEEIYNFVVQTFFIWNHFQAKIFYTNISSIDNIFVKNIFLSYELV